MKIKITIIEIDFPDPPDEPPVCKPCNPLTPLIEKLCKEAERGRDSTPWTTSLEDKLYGSFLSQ